MGGKLQVVVGGQYGSEGKGSITAWLAEREMRSLMAIRVGGPNAGHTVVDRRDRQFALQCVPVAAAVKTFARLAIAAGSEVDVDLLHDEVERLEAAGHRVRHRLQIDTQASILTQRHHDIEHGGVEEHGAAGLTRRIGSTGKGIGACRADRIMRNADLAGTYGGILNLDLTNVAREAAHHLQRGGTVQIEGTQGFGLGLHAGFYPFCTSGDCRAVDFLAQVGLSPWADYVDEFEVWVVFRTLPIRVAGNSGPLFGEMTWHDLHVESAGRIPEEDELTTVTRKQRRIGRWDPELARHAVLANGGAPTVRAALTFLDYIFPIQSIQEMRGDVLDWLRAREDEIGMPFSAVAYGPSLSDVMLMHGAREEAPA